MKDAKIYLESHGLIPLSPAEGLVSLVDLILGPGVTGNWWGHDRANDAYNAYSALANDPNVIVVKLIDYKVTLVHRNIWNPIFKIALDDKRISWRKSSLSPEGLRLFEIVEKFGSVGLDFIVSELEMSRTTLTKERKKLEGWGLVLSKEEHTSSGRHDIVLESWTSAARKRVVAPPASLTLISAYQEIKSRIGRHKLSLALP
ncbi:hypothetical protein [Mesorhizobium sp. B4-1-1]|uniref:hypothetical protein n=1 Tax=Mesorhizobium sp. B4-1-1 TaxID=2589890 RepID=UPI0011263DA4|nr:hypothetical protein [Mesorhizobium sp. B4-1-1]TPI21094.1 hypothetical protein FJW10_10150 [Mesorhizobium sp. B4-1-1]